MFIYIGIYIHIFLNQYKWLYGAMFLMDNFALNIQTKNSAAYRFSLIYNNSCSLTFEIS